MTRCSGNERHLKVRVVRFGSVAAAAAVTVASLVGLNGAASAATQPAWRLVKAFGISYGDPQINGGVAVSARQAWFVGDAIDPSNSLFLIRRSAGKWVPQAVPAPFANLNSTTISDSVVAESGSALWTFPTLLGTRVNTYALRLSGGHWTTYHLPKSDSIDGTAVFSPSDVWAFGTAVATHPVLGFGPPYVARFDGHRWRRVAMPGDPLQVTVLSKSNIWAFGPTARTAGNATPVDIAMHWTGRVWRTLTIPRVRAKNGKLAYPASLTALRNGDLWAVDIFHCPTPGLCEPPQPPGMYLLRWHKGTWRTVLFRRAYTGGYVEPDGHGGLWIGAFDVNRGELVNLHYQDGRLTQTLPPAHDSVFPPILIPGTRAVWAAGSVSVGGISESAIFTRSGA
jgi:hypothetical protein